MLCVWGPILPLWRLLFVGGLLSFHVPSYVPEGQLAGQSRLMSLWDMVRDMDLLMYVLLVLVATLSLSGTFIMSHTLKAELSHLRNNLELERSKLEELRVENERLKLELERVKEAIEHVDELEEVVKLLLERKERKSRESGIEKQQVARDPMLDLKIISLYRQGYSIRKIAEMVGLSKSTVHRIVKKALVH